jgi:hypothetical protein
MAILTITPSDVVIVNSANNRIQQYNAWEAITAGQLFSVISDLAQLAVNSSEAAATVVALALNTAEGPNQPIQGLLAGTVTIGTGTIASGYYLSSTAGSLELESDQSPSDWSTFAGIIVATGVLEFQPLVSGAQRP